MPEKWRVKAKCHNCGRIWETNAKTDPGAPARCSGEDGCGSYRTEGIKANKVKT